MTVLLQFGDRVGFSLGQDFGDDLVVGDADLGCNRSGHGDPIAREQHDPQSLILQRLNSVVGFGTQGVGDGN